MNSVAQQIHTNDDDDDDDDEMTNMCACIWHVHTSRRNDQLCSMKRWPYDGKIDRKEKYLYTLRLRDSASVMLEERSPYSECCTA